MRPFAILLLIILISACAPMEIRRTALIPPPYGTLRDGGALPRGTASLQLSANPLDISLDQRDVTREKVDPGVISAKDLMDLQFRVGITKNFEAGMKFIFQPWDSKEKSAPDTPDVSFDQSIMGVGWSVQFTPVKKEHCALGMVGELSFVRIPYTVYEIQGSGSLSTINSGTEVFGLYNLALIPGYRLRNFIFSGGTSIQNVVRNVGYEKQTYDTSSTLYTKSGPPVVFLSLGYDIKKFFAMGQVYVPGYEKDDIEYTPGVSFAVGYKFEMF